LFNYLEGGETLQEFLRYGACFLQQQGRSSAEIELMALEAPKENDAVLLPKFDSSPQRIPLFLPCTPNEINVSLFKNPKPA